jgi:hypothetical protein
MSDSAAHGDNVVSGNKVPGGEHGEGGEDGRSAKGDPLSGTTSTTVEAVSMADLVSTMLMLDPDLIEWGKQQPQALSETVRRLLREAKANRRG